MSAEFGAIQLTQSNDIWSYKWGSSLFSTRKAYKHLLGSIAMSPVYNWLWKSSCQSKRKFFFWLFLKDRLSTREILRRRNMELPSYSCVLCFLNTEESLHHLFMDCPFARYSAWNWRRFPSDEAYGCICCSSGSR